MINLGNKIRELRKKKGITQEGLASALNMSPQAISKWEMGTGYPDVAMLPVIAGYFGVSLDTLFDYDSEETEEKIRNILYSTSGKEFDVAEKILLDGIAAYPGADSLKRELLERYATQIRRYGRTELKDRALAIGEKLMTESGDFRVVMGAKGDVADIYISTGEYEKGKEIIESMPYIYHLDIYDRMRCSVMFLRAEDSMDAAMEWKQWAEQELYMVCSAEGMGYFELGDYENAIRSFEEGIGVVELFRHRDVPKFRPHGDTVHQGFEMVRIAACLYKMGRLTECDAKLQEAYEKCRDSFNGNYGDGLVKQYRDIWSFMGLNEYKPCNV